MKNKIRSKELRTKQKNLSRKAAVLISVITITVIAGISIAAAVIGGNKIEARLIDEESGEYMLVNVPQSYAFEIESNGVTADDYEVYDILGEKVQTDNQSKSGRVKIKAPENGYQKGQIYTIDITDKGVFLDEKYKDAKKLTFIIEQKETKELVFQNGVLEPEDEDVQLKQDNIVLNGKYKNDNIIVADVNKDQIDDIYKLKNVEYKNGKTTAEYEEPKPEEVYKKVNIFYYDDIDFRNAEIDEDALIGTLEETGILDAFTEASYAAGTSNINVKVDKGGKNSYRFTVVLKDPNNSERQLKITLGISDRILVKRDDNVAVVDNNLKLTSGLEFSVKGEDSEDVENAVSKALEDYKSNEGLTSSDGEYDVPLIPIKIPIIGPIVAYADLGLAANLELSAEFYAGVDSSVSFTQGIIWDCEKNKVQKTYADITGDIDASVTVLGKLNAFAGTYLEVGVEIPLLLELGVDAKGGPYLDTEGCFSVKGIPKDIKTKGYYIIELGMEFSAGAKVKPLAFDDIPIDIADKKKPLLKYSKYLALKDVNLEAKYYIRDECIDIGELEAKYYNIINDEPVVDKIPEYALYIDGDKTNVKDGVIQDNISKGKHEFKLKWKYDGDKFETKKTVEVSDFDPWGHFDKIDLRGKTYREIEEEYGFTGETFDDNGGEWFRLKNPGMWVLFSCESTVEDYRTYAVCEGVGGTTKTLFGIDGRLDKKTAETLLELEFEKFEDVELGDYYVGKKTLNEKGYVVGLDRDSIFEIEVLWDGYWDNIHGISN